MRAELRNIQRRTEVTFVYITHDQTEALTMSDRVGVMSIGKLEQVAKPGIAVGCTMIFMLLVRLQFKARNFVYGVLVSPIFTPGIILGNSTFLFGDSYMNIPGGLWTAILGQSIFISSYYILLLYSSDHVPGPAL